MMFRILGFCPVTISREHWRSTLVPSALYTTCGGPVVRLSTSTECSTRWGQKLMGQALASRVARTISMMDRMARSATPLSWCTCGGQVVRVIDSLSRYSENSLDMNSPALSRCSWPTMRTRSASGLPTLHIELSLATKDLTRLRASLLFLRKYTCLSREWSSTSTRKYVNPCSERLNGPAMSP